MQLSEEEYARKRIHNGSSVQIENSFTPASLVIPNSYALDGIFNQHLTTIKDSDILSSMEPEQDSSTTADLFLLINNYFSLKK